MTDVRFPDDFNLADYWLFDRIKEGKGDKVALRFGDRSWTYAQVAERSRALARALIDLGLRPEQRVYIVLPDTPAFAWGIFGTLAAGGVLTMGNPIAPTEDLAYVLDYVRAAVLITTPRVAAELAPSFRGTILVSPDAATGDDPLRRGAGAAGPGARRCRHSGGGPAAGRRQLPGRQPGRELAAPGKAARGGGGDRQPRPDPARRPG